MHHASTCLTIHIKLNLLAQQQILCPVQQLSGQVMQLSLRQSAEQSPPQNGAVPMTTPFPWPPDWQWLLQLAWATASISLANCILISPRCCAAASKATEPGQARIKFKENVHNYNVIGRIIEKKSMLTHYYYNTLRLSYAARCMEHLFIIIIIPFPRNWSSSWSGNCG